MQRRVFMLSGLAVCALPGLGSVGCVGRARRRRARAQADLLEAQADLTRAEAEAVRASASAAPPEVVVYESGAEPEPSEAYEGQGYPVPPARPPVGIRPVRPSPAAVWIAGAHIRRGGAWVWVPGRYVVPPRPGARWRAGRWVLRGRRWVWIAGHWSA